MSAPHPSAVPGPGRHPDEAALRTWLDTGGPRSIDDHVATCDDCAARLEELTDVGDAGVLDELVAATAPPPDLAGRTTVRVRDRLATQESVSVLVEMLSLPLRTFAVLLGGDEPTARITGAGITGSERDSGETAEDDGE